MHEWLVILLACIALVAMFLGGWMERGPKMRLLICYDVDGTLWTSAGPVTRAMVERLAAVPEVAQIIVSPSAARPNSSQSSEPVDCFGPECVDGQSRADNLRHAALHFPADLYLYVSDNGDVDQAIAAGFVYVDREAFAASFA